jgi:Transposase DDE domain
MAYYRLINNKKVSTEAIITGFTKSTSERIEPVHYLCFQDTTQVNLESNRGHISPNSGLGVIADNQSLGFYLHPSLVMKASNESCVGFSFIKSYIHAEGGANRHERKYNYLPIEEKESYRWIECVQQTSKTLSNASMITHIQDREGDIFQLLATHTSKDHFIIRSTYNRKIQYKGEICDLYETLALSPLRDTYQLDVRGDIRKNTVNRQAIMELRYIEVEVQPPLKLSQKVPLSPIKVVAIEAQESPSTVPDGQEPVHWRILTTHQIKDFSDACQIVYWYSLRWHIETLFRLLKTQGFDIENIELENGEAIIKMTLFALWASLKVMALLLSSKTIFPNQNQLVNELFTENEIECLKALNIKFSGNTEKLKNPYPDTALSWAFWVVARLGGWKGYNSQRPPGVIILYKGIKKLELILIGYDLQRCV